MIGGFGNDTYTVDHWWDVASESGGQGVDVVRTSTSYALTAGSDIEVLETTNQNGTAALVLLGNANGNVIRGNNGDNVIAGGDGNDELTGFGGQDAFLFSTALNEAFNVDVITDFDVVDDTIRLDQDIFSSSLGLGNIADGEFVIGAAAQDANDRIIYDSNTGALYYDADGAGGNAAVQFAQLGAGLALTHLDFLVV
jgi:Ca2+-binding RTX toxin-like protein